jgi:acyl-coenzyme A thioesterase PaaI-like protein
MPDAPPAAAFEFDTATAVRPIGDGTFAMDVDAGFTVGPKPNGGYLLAAAARAAGLALGDAGSDHRDPLAATAHYLRAPDPGPAEIRTEVLRLGRGASHVRATLRAAGKACVDATFTLGTLPDPAPQPFWSGIDPVVVPPLEDCFRLESEREGMPFTVSIMDRSDVRLDPAVVGFATGQPSGTADLRGWISFADGRPADPLGLLFFVDALPPATFELVQAGWVPTLSLTSYVRARPAAGPLRIRQRAQVVQDGRFDEICEIWDATGTLVAEATQLAAIRIPEGTEAPPRG